MSAFDSRSTGYKIGVLGLFIALLLIAIGYASPYWYQTKDVSFTNIDSNQGLWILCLNDIGSYYEGCHSIGVSGVDAWFHIVRLFETGAMVLLAIACLMALGTNCCRAVPGPRSVALEALSAIGGISGFIGAMIFVGKTSDQVKSVDGAFFSWAFYLATVGSIIAFLDAILIGLGNKATTTTTTTTTTSGQIMGMSTVGGQAYVNTGAQPQAAYGVYPPPSAPYGQYPPQAGPNYGQAQYIPPPQQAGYPAVYAGQPGHSKAGGAP